MVGCYHPGCNSGANGKTSHIFKFPKNGGVELQAQWIKNIPKRADKDWNFKNCKLCFLHFEEKFIIKTSCAYGVHGEVICEIPRKNWTLAKNAVPTIFANSVVPKYFNKPSTRNSPRKRKWVSIPEHFRQKKVLKLQTNARGLNLEDLKLPLGWGLSAVKSEDFVFRANRFDEDLTNHSFIVDRSLTLHKDGKHELLIRGEVFDSSPLGLQFETCEEISNSLRVVDNLKLCQGTPLNSDTENIRTKTAVTIGNSIYSPYCKKLNPDNLCDKCKSLRKYVNLRVRLLKRKNQQNNGSNFQDHPTSSLKMKQKYRQKLQNATKKLKRLTKRSISDRRNLLELRKKLRLVMDENLEEKIDGTNLPDNLKMTIRTAFRIAKTKSAQGKRYESGWLLQALLLKIKSPKGYRFLRENNLLPLPHASSLKQLIAGLPCEFGFSTFIFEALKKQLQNLPELDRHGVLLLDEMKIKESLRFKKHSQKFEGFIDYGEYTESYLHGKKTNTYDVADHALVLMFRSINSNWAQPIACFASKCAAPGEILAKVAISCILKLEAVGAYVDAIISDGATSNKKMWKVLGIHANASNVVNRINHPSGGSRCLYFLCDVPHIFKCIRNYLITAKNTTFQGKAVSFKFYRDLYEEDSKNLLRAIPKLTVAHIMPDNFQKMVVSLATQLFSKSVADGLSYFRKLNSSSFNGSEQTENLTRTLNDVFDALNARKPMEGLRMGSNNHKILLKFYEDLMSPHGKVINNFVSVTTSDAFKITLKSTLDLLEYFTKEVGFKYLLTAKLNQDYLEKFFGLIRSCGGDSDSPTATSFLQIFRLLSVYVPITRTMSGNCRQSEDPHHTLVGIGSLLNDAKSHIRKANANRKSCVEDKILERIIFDAPSEKNDSDHTSLEKNYPASTSPVVFHLCGYLAHKAKTFTKCQNCLTSLTSTVYEDAPEAILTQAKTMGYLKYPSRQLYHIISAHVDPFVEQKLNQGDFIGDFIESLVLSLDTFKVDSFGCSDRAHGPKLLVQIINYYISIRMYFFVRIYNKEQRNSSRDQKKFRKLSKLVRPQQKRCSE